MTLNSKVQISGPLPSLVIGLMLMALAAVGMAAFQWSGLSAELADESTALHRLTSQRVDQHDAHMTALSAVASASEAQRHDLMLEVASTISTFYPRIDEIQLVPLSGNDSAIGTRHLSPGLAETIRSAALQSSGATMLQRHPERPGHYILVKRSPNNEDARFGLMLAIDVSQLLADIGPFWSKPGVGLSLSLPDGERLFQQGALEPSVDFSWPLSSVSQPLVLSTGMAFSALELLPPAPTLLLLLGVAMIYALGLWLLRQRIRTRRALEQARLNALDSRLAHASRVNALGEMGSGLAHELTQPLTAILAQVQAGRRLLGQGNLAALAIALDDTVQQARRASALLDRFRNWTRPHESRQSVVDLRDAIGNVNALLAPQAATQGVALSFEIENSPLPVTADPVEMEQVAFNLIRNAIEAIAESGSPGHVWVRAAKAADMVWLEVSDDGPGIAKDLKPRLFTPFTTTRPNGTGLGLALSQRLVERVGGEIAMVETEKGAMFRVVLPFKDPKRRGS